MANLENYEPSVQSFGLRTNKDAYFGGAVTFAGTVNGAGISQTTVGLTESDYSYSVGMSPVHYASAVNSALSDAGFGTVLLKGETVGFTSVSGEVIAPVSNVNISGSGTDKTIINTSRTDYVFKYTNTGTRLTNSGLSKLTLDCQNISIVSGMDIRNFSNYCVSNVKFKNGTQWFARFGNEPSVSTSAINDHLVIEDCIFDTHDGIYEMLLIYNTDTVDINRCTFSNKTGSAGAAPAVGIWQKSNYIKVRNSLFQNLASSAVYYSYTTNKIAIEDSNFLNVGQGLRGSNVSDNGKFSVTQIDNILVDKCNFIGGSNSVTTEAIQLGSVKDFTVSQAYISSYGKGIRIGYGNSTPTAADGGAAYYPSTRGKIDKVTFVDINSAGNSVTLNSPIYFGNGGDFGNLVISNITVVDPNDYLDYAVIFNGGTTATATVAGGAVTAITLSNTFAWYSTAPTVTITGNGTGATATATINADGQVTGFTVTNGGSGYTAATVAVTGANYKNIRFIDCDFGGKQIRVNDTAQLDTTSIKFENCTNFDTSNLSSTFIDLCIVNRSGLIQHDGKLGVAMTTSALNSNTDLQVGDGSATTTFRHNNVRHINSSDSLQTIFANFSGKTETYYKNNTNASSKRSVFDVDTGVYSANGFDANLGTDVTTPGVVVKRLTTTQRDAIVSPTNGALIYNTTTDKFQGYENGSWTNLI